MTVGIERPLALLLALAALPMLYNAVAREDSIKRWVSLSRALLVVLLAVAVAGPTFTSAQPVHQEPRLTVLADESMSASVLDEPDISFEGVDVRRRVIASGNRSELKKTMLRQLESDTNYVAVSDFQGAESLDGLAERFNEVNSTLNVLRADEEHESAVRIEGPRTTVPGAETRFRVVVSSTGEPPAPRLELDGSEVQLERTGEGTWTFTRSFSSEGVHRLEAAIAADDRYRVNNVDYRTVEVAEKPEILVVGGRGGLGAELERFYDVSYSDDLPADLEEFYAVVTKKDVEGVSRYLMEGNGLVYTGDPQGDAMEVLPVKTVPDEDRNEGTKIVLAIDISTSTAEEGAVKRSKAIAYNLVELLPFNNRVGAVAYNDGAFLVAEPSPLSLNREELQEKIARLETSGPSLHDKGLKGAEELINGTGNVIWITDGKIGALGSNTGVPSKTRDFAEEMDARLIAVAVGEDANRDFLQDVASRAGGMYMDSSETGRLKFVFRAGGAAGEASRLVVINPDHFVTRGEGLSGSATSFDPVEPRRGAELLVTGANGHPFLTTWRYGLGRVAAFSGGDTELSRLRSTDPSLLLRAVSWSVGDPNRKEDRWLEVGQGYTGEPVEVRASHPMEGLRRQGEDLYTGEVRPDGPGFHSFAGKPYAYSYNRELSRVGYRDVESIARQTGGEVYGVGERAELREQAREFSSRTVETKNSGTKYLLGLALLLFLGEVGYRKWNGRM